MPSKSIKPAPKELPETGRHVWREWQAFFEKQRADIIEAYRQDGPIEAHKMQDNILFDLGGPGIWARMFEEGRVREYRIASAVESARSAFYEFLRPVENPTVESLRLTKRMLQKTVDDIREEVGNGEKAKAHYIEKIDLSGIFDCMEEYFESGIKIPEAQKLIDEIHELIKELNSLKN